jgi:predicted nuclease with TOPRIM domain
MEEEGVALRKVREAIQRTLERLDTEEEQLKREALELPIEISELQKRIREIESGASPLRLEEISKALHLGVRVRSPYITLAKHLISTDLQRILQQKNSRLQSIPQRLEEIQREREKARICPSCNGLGSTLSWEYVREDDVIIPTTSSRRCILCDGHGKINL